MTQENYTYVIVGAGLAGASAVEGIRECDPEGSILLIGKERDRPYHRPPLSKALWFGKKKVEQIFIHDSEFYESHHVQLARGCKAVRLDAANHVVFDEQGVEYHYRKLLLATGARPRRLRIPGDDLPGICYFRTLADYFQLRSHAEPGATVLVVGGGFIGSELAAALCANHLQVTLLFRDPYLLAKIMPESLSQSIQQDFRGRDIEMIENDVPTRFEQQGHRYMTHTQAGRQLMSDAVVIGIGITPELQLAESAGLHVEDGIVVDEYLRTSSPDIWAAGDNALFPEPIIGPTRVEHWDNAKAQGHTAGRNMAGAHEPYDYLPYFFSDLFELGYEAVGLVTPRLDVLADWQVENQRGTLYFRQEGKVRGVMNCNIFGQMDAARELIRSDQMMSDQDLRGVIHEPAERG